jgi:SAM-dependent methyltransferase
MDMNFTGERFVPQLRGQIYYEHFHRYALGLSIANGKDVLDVASGEGYGAAFLAMVARSVIGVDIDEASVRHAAARYPAMNLSFRAGSASQIPLADSSVDVITSFETIEHLVEHEQMLHEMARVLRPDGHLLISSPNRLVYSDARGYSNPFHVRELYFHEFRDLLRTFFPEVHIYGQRVFAACAIHPIGAASVNTRWLGPSLTPEPGLPGLPDAEYFVAICGRIAGEELPNLSTVYLDLRDDLLSDVRSGGIMAADSPVAMMTGGSKRTNGIIAIASPDDHGSKEEARLTKQNLELEALRSAEFDRADAAERDLRALRKREAEGLLQRENLALELRDVSAQLVASQLETQSRDAAFELLTSRLAQETSGLGLLLARIAGLELALKDATARLAQESSETERLKLESESSAAFVELLLERIAGLELALEDAMARLAQEAAGTERWKLESESRTAALELLQAALVDVTAQAENMERSRSWRMTAPFRQVVTFIRK